MAAVVNYFPAVSAGGGIGFTTNDIAWFNAQLGIITGTDATLVNVVLAMTLDMLPPLAYSTGGSSTILHGTPGTADFQSGATGASAAQAAPGVSIAAADKIVANMRTTHWAVAARATSVANHAGSDLRMAGCGDNATTNGHLGILGSTSTANYVTYIGGVPVSTVVAQSAAGTWDNLILINDGTNFRPFIGLADTTATENVAARQASTVIGTAGGFPHLYCSNGGTASNTGYRISHYMVVVPAGPLA